MNLGLLYFLFWDLFLKLLEVWHLESGEVSSVSSLCTSCLSTIESCGQLLFRSLLSHILTHHVVIEKRNTMDIHSEMTMVYTSYQEDAVCLPSKLLSLFPLTDIFLKSLLLLKEKKKRQLFLLAMRHILLTEQGIWVTSFNPDTFFFRSCSTGVVNVIDLDLVLYMWPLCLASGFWQKNGSFQWCREKWKVHGFYMR